MDLTLVKEIPEDLSLQALEKVLFNMELYPGVRLDVGYLLTLVTIVIDFSINGFSYFFALFILIGVYTQVSYFLDWIAANSV